MNKSDYNPTAKPVREFEITTCSACSFCHEIKLAFDTVYFCGALGIVLQKDGSRPVLPDECQIKKIIIEGEDE